MTTALEGGEWSAARSRRTLPPGKTRYPLYRRLSGSQGRSGRAENLARPGFDPRNVQPVVSRYTDWAIAAHSLPCNNLLNRRINTLQIRNLISYSWSSFSLRINYGRRLIDSYVTVLSSSGHWNSWSLYVQVMCTILQKFCRHALEWFGTVHLNVKG